MAPKYRFAQTKDANPERVAELLALSRENHQYTNNGPVKALLEKHLQKLLGLHGKRVICFTNGTAALHALMFHCGLDRTWAVPAYTFPSAAVGINAKVVLCDIAPPSFTADPQDLPPCEGVILTNLFGASVDLDMWVQFCKTRRLALILDNAGSPLSKCGGRNICDFDAYSFGSLHHTKYLGFGEGGFAVVPEDEYEAVKSLSSFGHGSEKNRASVKTLQNYNPASSNFKMSDVAAAYILAHLESYDIESHLRVQKTAIRELAKLGVRPLGNQPGEVYWSLPLVFDHPIELADVDRNLIESWKYYKPLADFPNCQSLYQHILNFPLYMGLGDDYLRALLRVVEKLLK